MVEYYTNGYRLWCPENKKIILGRDIIFNESRYSLEENFYKAIPKETQEKATSSIETNQIQDSNNNSSSSEESETYKSADEEELDHDGNTNILRPDNLQKPVTPRCSTRIKTRPKHLEDYIGIALNAEAFVEDVPQDYQDIQQREDKWYDAVREEITSLLSNKT